MNKSNWKILICTFITLLYQIAAFCSDNVDGQLWSGLKFKHELFPNTEVFLTQWFRSNDNMSELYWIHSDIGMTFSVAKWFSAGFNFWHVHKSKKDVWYYDNRPKIRTTFKVKAGILALSNRNLFEYHIIKAKKDAWIYRNKATCSFDLKLKKAPFKPYVADEIFVSFTDRKFQYNRIYGGIKWKFTKNVGLHTGYFWQAEKKKEKSVHKHVAVLCLAIGN